MYPVDLLILLRERRYRVLRDDGDEVRTIDTMIQFIESEILTSSIPCDLREYRDRFILTYGQGNNLKSKIFEKKENTNMKWEYSNSKVLGTREINASTEATTSFSFSLTKEGEKAMKKLIKRDMGNPTEIEKVIFNDPATIVFWGNGDKTVVKCGKDDIYDPEKGLAMAISKRFLGNEGNYFNVFKKWLPKEEHKTELSEEAEAYVKNDIKAVADAVKRYVNRLSDILLRQTNKELVNKSFAGAPEADIKKLIDESRELIDIWKETK